MRFTQLIVAVLAVAGACVMFGRGAEPVKPTKPAAPAVKTAKPAAPACPDGKCPAPAKNKALSDKAKVQPRDARGRFLPMPKGSGPVVVKVAQPLLTVRTKVRVRSYVAAHNLRGRVRGAVLKLVGR
jgi:hypothetical protein